MTKKTFRFLMVLLLALGLATAQTNCSKKRLRKNFSKIKKKYGKKIKSLEGKYKKLEKKYAKQLKGKKTKAKPKTGKKGNRPVKVKTARIDEPKRKGKGKGKGDKKGGRKGTAKPKTDEAIIFVSDMEKGLAEAKKRGRDVLVIVSIKPCPPCQAMKDSVYPNPSVQAKLTDYVVVTDDYTAGTGDNDTVYLGSYGSNLAEGGVYYTPTFGVFKANGQFVKKTSGGMDAATFGKWLD